MREWSDLFSPSRENSAPTRSFTLLKKEGHPILFLPSDRAMAEATLRLYPAQTFLARTLFRTLGLFSPRGIGIAGETRKVAINEDRPFAQFLKSLIPGSRSVPPFGVMSGNIKMAGRRYVVLLFDAEGKPAAVVKVGGSKEARQLVRFEQDIFFPKPLPFPGLPEVLAIYDDDEASAIAYRYVEGKPPTPEQRENVGSLLESWIYEQESVAITRLPIWTELTMLAGESPDLKPLLEKLEKCSIRPVLFHGDFAPWNIRVTSSATGSRWVVLDWERSSRYGLPGWDWFHYIFQYNTLVRRVSAEENLAELEALWKDTSFLAYAKKTGTEHVVRELAFLYLLYLERFHSPRDKAAQTRRFLKEFTKRYFPRVVILPPKLRISVITPSYKQLPWLKLCVASIADQKGVEIEHIIQDAQSGGELEEWVRTNTQSQLHVECDSGMYDAINRGFIRATGDIVCWLNSDEQYLEGSLSTVARFFEMHPEIDVLFGDALLVGNKGNLLSYRRTVPPKLRHIQASHLNVLSCATFVRRSVLEQGYHLDTRWKTIADAVWVVDLLQAGIPMAVMHKPLAVFTITDKNLGQTNLATSEVREWRQATSPKSRWLSPLFVLWHRITKFLNGAYWPRFVSVRIYTLASSQKRVLREARQLGFRWPGKRDLDFSRLSDKDGNR
jgi:glycosyltransferase involved in cell wall biosynthesis